MRKLSLALLIVLLMNVPVVGAQLNPCEPNEYLEIREIDLATVQTIQSEVDYGDPNSVLNAYFTIAEIRYRYEDLSDYSQCIARLNQITLAQISVEQDILTVAPFALNPEISSQFAGRLEDLAIRQGELAGLAEAEIVLVLENSVEDEVPPDFVERSPLEIALTQIPGIAYQRLVSATSTGEEGLTIVRLELDVAPGSNTQVFAETLLEASLAALEAETLEFSAILWDGETNPTEWVFDNATQQWTVTEDLVAPPTYGGP